jgi:hypothetical protein
LPHLSQRYVRSQTCWQYSSIASFSGGFFGFGGSSKPRGILRLLMTWFPIVVVPFNAYEYNSFFGIVKGKSGGIEEKDTVATIFCLAIRHDQKRFDPQDGGH